MKQFLVEKGVIILTVFFSIHSSQQPPLKIETKEEVKKEISQSVITPLNIDSLVEPDRKIMEKYNNSVIKKNESNEKILKATKKEIENAKLINELTLSIINKAKESKEKKDCKIVTSDTICTKYKHKLFKKTDKCIEKEVTIYLIEDNKKTKLQTINIK